MLRWIKGDTLETDSASFSVRDYCNPDDYICDSPTQDTLIACILLLGVMG